MGPASRQSEQAGRLFHLSQAINIHLSFEEALKLHLGLTQILGHRSGYNRSTTLTPSPSPRGRGELDAGVNLCLFPGVKHITINEGRVQEEE